MREAQMPTKEELKQAHDDGGRGVNRPIKGLFIEHFSTKRDRELQKAWRKGEINREKQQNK
jgi:hypothetical protein